MTAKSGRGSIGPSADTLRLISKVRLRFQSQRRPLNTPGILAKAPRWQSGLSTRQCRGSAGRTCASADRRPNFGPLSSGDLSRSQRIRNSHDFLSRCLHIEVDLASAARLVATPASLHHSALIVPASPSSPVGETAVRASLSASRTHRGGATSSPSRCAPWEHGRATRTRPRCRRLRARRWNRCGR
jgi:hypothetical protein